MFVLINKIAIITILAFMAHALAAQEIPSRENEGVHNMVSRNARKNAYSNLNLSKEQQKNLQALNKENRSKVKEITADSTLTPKERRVKLQAVRQQTADKRKNIFTEAQYATYRQNLKTVKQKDNFQTEKRVVSNVKENKEKDANGLSIQERKRSVKGKNVNRNNLQLTTEQRKKMKLANDNYKSKVQLIKNDTSISAAERQSQIKNFRRAYQLEVGSILTAEQKANWFSGSRK